MGEEECGEVGAGVGVVEVEGAGVGVFGVGGAAGRGEEAGEAEVGFGEVGGEGSGSGEGREGGGEVAAKLGESAAVEGFDGLEGRGEGVGEAGEGGEVALGVGEVIGSGGGGGFEAVEGEGGEVVEGGDAAGVGGERLAVEGVGVVPVGVAGVAVRGPNQRQGDCERRSGPVPGGPELTECGQQGGECGGEAQQKGVGVVLGDGGVGLEVEGDEAEVRRDRKTCGGEGQGDGPGGTAEEAEGGQADGGECEGVGGGGDLAGLGDEVGAASVVDGGSARPGGGAGEQGVVEVPAEGVGGDGESGGVGGGLRGLDGAGEQGGGGGHGEPDGDQGCGVSPADGLRQRGEGEVEQGDGCGGDGRGFGQKGGGEAEGGEEGGGPLTARPHEQGDRGEAEGAGEQVLQPGHPRDGRDSKGVDGEEGGGGEGDGEAGSGAAEGGEEQEGDGEMHADRSPLEAGGGVGEQRDAPPDGVGEGDVEVAAGGFPERGEAGEGGRAAGDGEVGVVGEGVEVVPGGEVAGCEEEGGVGEEHEHGQRHPGDAPRSDSGSLAHGPSSGLGRGGWGRLSGGGGPGGGFGELGEEVSGGGVVRVESEDFLQRDARAVEVADESKQVADAEVARDGAGVVLDGVAVGGDRVEGEAELLHHVADDEPGGFVLGGEFGEFADTEGELLSFGVGGAALFGGELADGVTEEGDSDAGVAGLERRVFEGDGGAVLVDGAGEILPGGEDVTDEHVRAGEAAVAGDVGVFAASDGLAEELEGLIVPALQERHRAE